MKAKNKKNYKYFVYTGNSYPHKNLPKLIEAIVILNKSTNEIIKLKISSSRNVFTQRLEKIIDDNNAKKYVELLGYVSDEEIGNLYENSVAFVFPTLSEGFGLPPKEAIESGTLAIISNIAVLKEVYADSCLHFDPNSPLSIAEAMIKVLKFSTKERQEKIVYAQNYLKKYSWHKMAQETLQIYEKV